MSASATSFLNGVVWKIEPCCSNSGDEAMLAPGERSAGFSKIMVVRAGERRAAMASSTVRSRSRLERRSSRTCLGSIWSSGRPSGCSKVLMIGGPRSPPSLLVASKKRAIEEELHGKAIISVRNAPARASASMRAKAASFSRS